MTLEEAIKHSEEVMKEQEELSKKWKECKDRRTIGWSETDFVSVEKSIVSIEKSIERCDKCAEEHRQLAKWLKELKVVHDEIDEIGEKLYQYKCYITDNEGLQHEVIYIDDIRRVTGWMF